MTITYGGSDNNHFFHHGISGLVVASGMTCCHACQEYAPSVSELERAARLVEGLIFIRGVRNHEKSTALPADRV
ncbi:MAG: hypothetical protein V8S71_11245 [Oscillospiraceae bacterium]